MLDMLEKLINEHGSSVILRERLELFSDKYTMLEEKNSHLQEHNSKLEVQLNEAKEEIRRLKEIIQENESVGPSSLDPSASQILEVMFDADQNISKEQVSSITGIEISMISYHFDCLREEGYITQATVGRRSSGFVSGRGPSSTPPTFIITPNGRKYVVEHIRT